MYNAWYLRVYTSVYNVHAKLGGARGAGETCVTVVIGDEHIDWHRRRAALAGRRRRKRNLQSCEPSPTAAAAAGL